jgi:hypothetical protein
VERLLLRPDVALDDPVVRDEPVVPLVEFEPLALVAPVVPALVPVPVVAPVDCAVATTAVASEIAATMAFSCACFICPPACGWSVRLRRAAARAGCPASRVPAAKHASARWTVVRAL